jgi:GntR family transcriptional regulator
MDPVFSDNQPIYLQIKQRIYAAILRGDFQPGDKLPAIIDMSMQFKVNHNTIQRVYQELIRDEIAVSKRGEGTFVTQNRKALGRLRGERQNELMEDFIKEMVRLGYREEELADILTYYIQSEHHNKGKD